MSGIIGFTKFKHKYPNDTEILSNMTNSIAHRGNDEVGYFQEKYISLGHRNFITSISNNVIQPMSLNYQDSNYTIVFNGQIYNSNKLEAELTELGFSFETKSDAEILIKAFIHYGYEMPKHLIGAFAFAIWNDKKQELFVVRDHFGIKPLYYTKIEGDFIFASEVKALFKYPNISPSINSDGICELFGIGPAHSNGYTAFKGILELPPAHFLVIKNGESTLKEYWKLESKPHEDNLEQTCEKVKYLLEDSIESQLNQDLSLCTFLSGGLDSSIISTYASNYYKNHNLGKLPTFSVDYVDNDKNFVKNDFQPNSDNEYINIMLKHIYAKHTKILLDTPDLVSSLKDAMIARDFPGMADVDSSLLVFCKNVKKDMKIALSGECADEIFGGYPWFFREDALNSNTFPWSLALSERQNLLNQNISKKVNLKEYIDHRYQESLDKVVILDSDSKGTAEKRKISYLTLNWFMQTLLDRSDRMSMYAGLELRVPFCDHRIVQYMWNVPWKLKALNGREKGLLRYIVKDILPSQIIDRKKSPYPKTLNPTYLKVIKELFSETLENSNAPIYDLLNKEYIKEILETDGKAFSRPWFGQLMTGPQLIAYLYQVNMWLETYHPKIEI